MGILIALFCMTLFVLLPLLTHYIEMKEVQQVKERLKAACDLALSEMVLEMDVEALSMGTPMVHSAVEGTYRQLLKEKMALSGLGETVDNLSMGYTQGGGFYEIEVAFQTPYVPKFVDTAFFKRPLHIRYTYQFPINH